MHECESLNALAFFLCFIAVWCPAFRERLSTLPLINACGHLLSYKQNHLNLKIPSLKISSENCIGKVKGKQTRWSTISLILQMDLSPAWTIKNTIFHKDIIHRKFWTLANSPQDQLLLATSLHNYSHFAATLLKSIENITQKQICWHSIKSWPYLSDHFSPTDFISFFIGVDEHNNLLKVSGIQLYTNLHPQFLLQF